MLAANRFRFLNEEGALAGPASWNDSANPKLWLYNLHYFDDLNAEDAGARRGWHQALIARWIDENPVGHGNGWEPYPLSLRIVNWVKWSVRGHEMPAEWLKSLATQARYLRKTLEYHLLGNHLFANAKALTFAGAFFAGAEAERWLAKGLAVLHKELTEQVLDDGGHFERSPMYHAIVYEDVLDLINLSHVYTGVIEPALVARLEQVAARMAQWLQVMTHPDGEIAFFNDAATGIAPRPADLYAYMQRLDLPVQAPVDRHLASSGYVRLENDTAVALLDVAPIGPDYLPGHAHADTLSFELSLFGRRVLVNSGVTHYIYDAERLRQRGTAAHNTVAINGEDSSEVWHAFRVARRARPFGLRVDDSRVECSHDGYKRLKGRPVHRRAWQLTGGMLEIRDAIEGRFDHAVAYFHLHPDVAVSLNPDRVSARLIVPGGRYVRLDASGGVLGVEPSTWHPQFGKRIPSRVVALSFAVPEATLTLRWDGA